MKGFILSMVAAVVICAAILEVVSSRADKVAERMEEIYDKEISIIQVGDCQYLKFVGYYKGGITHKGDCNNPIHDWNK